MIEHAEVLKAIAEGKDVQYKAALDWIDTDLSIFTPLTHHMFEWRIKSYDVREAWEYYKAVPRETPTWKDIFYAGFKAGKESKND